MELHFMQKAARILLMFPKRAAAESLTGFEFACGIPGSVGGAMAMNAGAYGGEIKDIIVQVTVLQKQGSDLFFRKMNLNSAIGKVLLRKKDIMSCLQILNLTKGIKKQSMRKWRILHFNANRNNRLNILRQEVSLNDHLAILRVNLFKIAGCKEKDLVVRKYRLKHAGFIVNKNNATASDYIQTIEMVKAEVKKNLASTELEVKIVGEEESKASTASYMKNL